MRVAGRSAGPSGRVAGATGGPRAARRRRVAGRPGRVEAPQGPQPGRGAAWRAQTGAPPAQISGSRLRRLLALCALALVLPGAAHAAKPPAAVDRAKAGIAKALAAGWLQPADASRYRGILARTAVALPRLGGVRHANLQAVLDDVARQAGGYTSPRALTLFGMLDENVRYFGAQGPPAPQADTPAPDGVVYRYFPGHGLQFHPLANFASLNSQLAAGRTDESRTLAEALRARAIPRGAGVVWEYEFAFGGGRPPWTSGMAQAVAAQALARAGQRLEDASLGELAGRAYLAIPDTLDMSVAAGRWVKLYSFSRLAVFNAQLQTAVSLRDYADLSGDTAPGALSDALRAAVTKALPRVDTGYWTRYAIGGAEESLGYHDFVITILGRLRTQTKDAFWSDLATRFRGYETQPPSFEAGAPAAPVVEAKQGQATFKLSFWLSKQSSVVVRVGSARRSLSMTNGWHYLTWQVPRTRSAVFPVAVDASPIAGPRASASLSPLVVLARAPASLGPLGLAAGVADAPAGPGLLVGAAENAVLGADPASVAAQLGLATRAGLAALRITAPWSPGQTAPDPALLAQLTTTAQQTAAAGIRLYLEVYPASAAVVPADDASRAAFASTVSALAVALPQVRDFVIGSQVNDPVFWPQARATPGSYLALLAASYDALKGVNPGIQVIGGALNAQQAPATFVLSLGQAYRRSGRTTPVMDALAIQPSPASSAEPPETVHPTGATTIADYPRLVANLKRAFDGTGQPGSTLPIVYDGYGVQTAVPAAKAALYSNVESGAVPEAVQAASYATALQLASCQPNVSAFLFQHVVDERDLSGSQSGLYYPDLTAKSSFPAVRAAVTAARGGTLAACPGATKPPDPAPSAEFAADGRSVAIACPLECYYTVVLTRGDAALRTRQGAVASGAALTVSVPASGVAPGDRLSVHVVQRHDPGAEVVQEGNPV